MLKLNKMRRTTWPRLNLNNIYRHRKTKINRLKNHLRNLLKKKITTRNRSISKKHHGVAVAGEVADVAVVEAGAEDVVKIINNNRHKRKVLTMEILRNPVAAIVEITTITTTIDVTIIARETKVPNHISKRTTLTRLISKITMMIMIMVSQSKSIMMLRSPK